MQGDLAYWALPKFSEEKVKEAHNNGLHLRVGARAVRGFLCVCAAGSRKEGLTMPLIKLVLYLMCTCVVIQPFLYHPVGTQH